MKRSLLFSAIGGMALVAGAASLAADKTKSEEAFDRLTSLKGDWKGEQEGVKISVSYTVTANGSALMEEFRPESGPVMITMFTVDGDHLTQEWTYQSKGKSGRTVFRYTRVPRRTS